MVLITDEIYSDICFDETQIAISAFDSNPSDSETVILTGGLSKVNSSLFHTVHIGLIWETDLLCRWLARGLRYFPSLPCRRNHPQDDSRVRFGMLVCCLGTGPTSGGKGLFNLS